jgi:hypothetical protein
VKAFRTYPVVVETTACRSFVQYNMTMAKMNDVKNPMVIVLNRARGTTTAAFLHSSARWMAPSMPAYIYRTRRYEVSGVSNTLVTPATYVVRVDETCQEGNTIDPSTFVQERGPHELRGLEVRASTSKTSNDKRHEATNRDEDCKVR